MRYETLEKYDMELREMENDLAKMEEYLKKHPESIGTKGNYETYEYVFEVYKNDKLEFIQTINEINLKLKGNQMNNPLSLTNMYSLGNKFNNTKKSAMKLLEVNSNSNEDLFIEEISKGSYNIKFSFPNPTEDDVKRTSLRKRGLMKIFDFINCGDDLEKLKKEAGPDGQEALMAYKKFLEEIIKNEADFTLDTEMGTVKAGLSLEECKNICENLKL